MYKIYINDNPLFLVAKAQVASLAQQFPGCLTGFYTGQIKSLPHYIDLLEKTPDTKVVVLYGADPGRLDADFRSLFRYVEAAGGLVFNPRGEALFIFRRGKWDLPKGKLEPGETPVQAAVREVREETGLQILKPVKELPSTYHTYREKGQRVLKRTYWFIMDTPDTELIPQAEEDIEKAVWDDISSFSGQKRDTYNSIRDVYEACLREGREKI